MFIERQCCQTQLNIDKQIDWPADQVWISFQTLLSLLFQQSFQYSIIEQTMEDIPEEQTIIDVPYKISAKILVLKIDKNLDFSTKIIWKRHQHKTETTLVQHINGYSTFDETLSLNLMMKYDRALGRYQDKVTKFLPAIVTEKYLKSGGEARYNVAEPLNREVSSTGNAILQTNQTLLLEKCPDQTGYIEVTFSYQRLEEYEEIQPSVIQCSTITSTLEEQSVAALSQIDSNISKSSSIPKSYVSNFSMFSKQSSFFMKKSANLERQLAEQEIKFEEEKSELQMKLLMLQEEMKELKNRLVDKDEELKHTKAWNESLIRAGERNESRLKSVLSDTGELQSLRMEKSVLDEKVRGLERLVIDKTTMIGNLLNTACDLGGRSLLQRISTGMIDT